MNTLLQNKLLERDKNQRQDNARKLFSESPETKVLGFSENIGSLKIQDIWKDQVMCSDARSESSIASTKPFSEQLVWAREQLARIGAAREISVYMPLGTRMPSQWTRLLTDNPSSLAAAAIVDGIVAVDEKTGRSCIIKVKEHDLQSFFRKYKIHKRGE